MYALAGNSTGGRNVDTARQLAHGVSVAAQRLAFTWLHVALKAPPIDNFGVEAPVGPDSESGEFATTQQLVNGGGMNSKVSGELPDRHHAGQIVLWFCHDSLSSSQANPSTPTSTQIGVFLCLTKTDRYPKPALTTSNVSKNANAGQEAETVLSTTTETSLWRVHSNLRYLSSV